MRTIYLLGSALCWDITCRRVAIVYRRFGTTHRSHLQGSRVREEDVSGQCIGPIFKGQESEKKTFRDNASVPYSRVKSPRRRRFGTTHRCHIQGSRVREEDVSGQCIGPIFKGQESEKKTFRDNASVPYSRVKSPRRRRFGTTHRSHLQGSRVREEKKPATATYMLHRKVRAMTGNRVEPLQMGPIRYPETSKNNYHTTLGNIPEESRFHQLRGGSLKSRVVTSGALVSRFNPPQIPPAPSYYLRLFQSPARARTLAFQFLNLSRPTDSTEQSPSSGANTSAHAHILQHFNYCQFPNPCDRTDACTTCLPQN
jgi:hypothetical protein